MKIAFVTTSLTGGGAERVISVLANQFIKEKNVDEVSIIAVVEDKVSYQIDESINYIANSAVGGNKISRVMQRFHFLKKSIKQTTPDVVISFCTQINIYAILSTLGLDCKLIISERNDPNNDPIQPSVRKLRDIIYRLCKHAVFQTPDAQNYFQHIIKGSTTVIMNPIKENLPSLYEGEREKRIVSAARLSEAKNIPLLIKAFKNLSSKYPDYTVDIYGEGPLRNELEAMIKEENLSEVFHLRGFSENVHEEIRKAACFVLPSNYEGISNSMIEAIGLGIPTVCTDCPIGGARMVIEDNVNGILIPVGDQKALELAIERILNDKEFCEKISHNAIQIKERLSSDTISKAWISFAEEVVGN